MEYKILGDDMQAIVLNLQSGESVRAEAGSMMYMTQSVQMSTQANTGGGQEGLLGALTSGLKRAISGDSFFITVYKAEGGNGQVAFAAPYPGKILPINLDETGGEIICQRHAYLCSDPRVDISVAFTRKLGAGFFGGEGFILQKLQGHGMAFIHSGGLILPVDLEPGQHLKVDTGCLVAMTKDVDYDIQMVPGIKTALFGGEGLFFATLTGPGRVYLQSLPFNRMADRIISASSLGASSEETTGVAGLGGKILGSLISGGE
jgi:uncharacterized protein (TIGR00266 family)